MTREWLLTSGLCTILTRRKSARGRGLAQVLMARALEIAGDKPLYLHAQDYVTSLYAKFGFERRGELFHEAGIPHVLMVRHPDA